MSRSGYDDDIDDPLAYGRWRGIVTSAIRGERGQALLREIEAALLALPTRELIADEFCTKEGDVCTLGAWSVRDREKRGHDRKAAVESIARKSRLHAAQYDSGTEEYADCMTENIDAADALLREIQYINDELGPNEETPQQRYERMLRWVRKNIKREVPQV